ncbi:MAG: HEAT repeat domain-containing protein, partial [Rhodospirillaceae bacterium]|nr:HEAT repeat domain-containing protein [Rhodospirillaceae bacterium]
NVADSPNTPGAVLEMLSGDEHTYVRSSVIFNPNTPVSMLEKLAGDEDESVRDAIVRCDNTPVSVLEMLAGDKSEIVRASVAYSPNTLGAVLEKLAGDEDKYVRECAVGNPNTPVVRGSKKKSIELIIHGMGVEIVVGHIDKETGEKINENMGWNEVEEIVGSWDEISDIHHGFHPMSPPEISADSEIIPKLEITEGGFEETIPIEGDGYVMVTISEEDGTLGSLSVDGSAKKINYYKSTYKIGDHDIDVVSGFAYKGKDLELDNSNYSTTGKSVDIRIYDCQSGEIIWS